MDWLTSDLSVHIGFIGTNPIQNPGAVFLMLLGFGFGRWAIQAVSSYAEVPARLVWFTGAYFVFAVCVVAAGMTILLELTISTPFLAAWATIIGAWEGRKRKAKPEKTPVVHLPDVRLANRAFKADGGGK